MACVFYEQCTIQPPQPSVPPTLTIRSLRKTREQPQMTRKTTSTVSKRGVTALTKQSTSSQGIFTRILLAIPSIVLIALAVLSSSPLWYARQVFHSQTIHDHPQYASLWVRVPYGLLCFFGSLILLTILLYFCIPLWMFLKHRTMHHLKQSTTHHPGTSLFFVEIGGLLVLAVGALMLFIMLPLYGMYRYNTRATLTPSTAAQSPSPATPATTA